MTIQEAINQAAKHEREGRLAEAEELCSRIIQQRPDMSEVWHLRSIVAVRAGNVELAVQFISKGIELNPGDAAMYSNLGEYYRRLGKRDASVVALRRALELQPRHPNSWNNLGNALKDQGILDNALAAYRKAAELQPDFAIAHNNVGVVLRLKGDTAGALAAFERAIAQDPNYSDAHGNRGNALRESGRLDEAIDQLKHAIQLSPESASFHANLGNALTDRNKFDEAIAEYEHALRLRPDYPEALNNYSNALRETERYDEALTAVERSIQLKPDYANAYNNLGSILFEQNKYQEAAAALGKSIELDPSRPPPHTNLGLALAAMGWFDEAIAECREAVRLDERFANGFSVLGDVLTDEERYEEAIAMFQRALEIDPDYHGAHINMAFLHLTRGEFDRGWAEYEWRRMGPAKSRPREFPQPRWDGSNLNGRTLLLHAEQGLGDTIQFVRYAPLIAARGGRVILKCPASLAQLLEAVAGIAEVVSNPDTAVFDFHCPLLSLPLVMGTRLENIPAPIPYIKAPHDLAANWKSRLQADEGFRVGIAWAGTPTHKRDRRRSLRLDQLSPLTAVEGVRFYSLQKGPAAAQAVGSRLVDLSADLVTMSDTAAVIENLDLVICVDTAVAHLAGAMGKPVWLLISKPADFRWLLERTDSPWYPTMRLFRQSQRGDWTAPIAQAAQALQELARSRGDGSGHR